MTSQFFGWRVTAAAFVLAVFGWGLGFYGPPVYLLVVREAHGWPVALISAAVTLHYLCGAAVITQLPKLYQRFGLPAVTRVGSLAAAIGVFGWSVAQQPWQLLAVTILSGGGWVTMAAAALNAIISPWFVRLRPKALSTAYNGASIGGVLFSPLWVLLIGWLGFPTAAALVGVLTVAIVWWMSFAVFRHTPASLGQIADGSAGEAVVARANDIAPLPGRALWRSRAFRTLATGMALGLVAQVGLLAHLLSLIAPVLGDDQAGLLLGGATVSAIAGRTMIGWLMPPGGDRRLIAIASYAVQFTGCAALLFSGLSTDWLIVLGVLLFGFGIGNATSLPPLIAQMEFAREDTQRVVSLVVAIAQVSYAFAPLGFGLLRGVAGVAEGEAVFVGAMGVMGLAMGAYWWGRRG